MTVSQQEGAAIEIGYEYRQRITVSGCGVIFPASVQLKAQVRLSETSCEVYAELTTANGGITRISNTEIEIVIPDTATAKMKPWTVVKLDLVRTDFTPPRHMRIGLGIPVAQPVTWGTP